MHYIFIINKYILLGVEMNFLVVLGVAARQLQSNFLSYYFIKCESKCLLLHQSHIRGKIHDFTMIFDVFKQTLNYTLSVD